MADEVGPGEFIALGERMVRRHGGDEILLEQGTRLLRPELGPEDGQGELDIAIRDPLAQRVGRLVIDRHIDAAMNGFSEPLGISSEIAHAHPVRVVGI